MEKKMKPREREESQDTHINWHKLDGYALAGSILMIAALLTFLAADPNASYTENRLFWYLATFVLLVVSIICMYKARVYFVLALLGFCEGAVFVLIIQTIHLAKLCG
jgi:hypothetical protein